MFQQPRADYSIHPQITSSSDTEDSSSAVVSDQPRLHGILKADSGHTSEPSLHGSAPSLSTSSAGGMLEYILPSIYILKCYRTMRSHI